MEMKRALLAAFAVAVVLPYLTIALVEGSSLGPGLVGVLFVGAFLLVVLSDVRDGRGEDPDASEDSGA